MTNEDIGNSINGSNYFNDNYEEANVSVIIDSEAGPIAIDGYNGGSYQYQSLTTTENYKSFYDDYDDSESSYDDEDDKESSSKTDNSNLFMHKFESAETLWNIFNTFNTMWNAYSSYKNNEKNKRETNQNSTELVEGRYIKGDPLKGYYDFVITEGSYKFWAAFQLATAVLIIYSTFAAIYYSKVNPLVGDYDYVDYLGGGRSFSDDADFVDDNLSENDLSLIPTKNISEDSIYVSANSIFYKWAPKMKYSLNFILNAIDKLPVRD